jgi:hypothetical protein
LPSISGGIAPAWIGVGVWYSRDFKADWISGMIGRSEKSMDTNTFNNPQAEQRMLTLNNFGLSGFIMGKNWVLAFSYSYSYSMKWYSYSKGSIGV